MKRSSFLKSLLGIAIAPVSVVKAENKYSYFDYFDKIIDIKISDKNYINYGIPIDVYYELNDYLKFKEYMGSGGGSDYDTLLYGGFEFHIYNLDRLKK